MTDPYQPTSEFVDTLGQELHSALRRQKKFGDPATTAPTRALRGQMRLLFCVALLAVVSICLGGAAAFAVVKKRDRQAAVLNVARAATQLEFAEQRATSFHFEFEFDYAFHFEFGEPPAPERDDAEDMADEELMALELEALSLDTQVLIRALDLEEVTLTGRAPNNSLSAPLVDDRDFVLERLELELEIAEGRLDLLTSQAEAEGLDELDQLILLGEVELAETYDAQLFRSMLSRESFLDGELSAGQLEWQRLHEAAIYKSRKASLFLEQVQYALQREKDGRGLGLQSLELRVRNAELQLQLAKLDVAMVQQRSDRVKKTE